MNPAPTEPQTLGDYLNWGIGLLKERIIETPQLDAELLLAHALDVERPYLICHSEDPLEPKDKIRYFQLLERRLRYEPIAYILERREFYGRNFVLNHDVLIPRPDSETMVDYALKWLNANPKEDIDLLDLGTGSGVLGITLSAEYQGATTVATDISEEALKVAEKNAELLAVKERMTFHQGDLFAALENSEQKVFDLIVTNPPYLNPDEKNALQADIRDFEPDVALFSPNEGLAIIEKIALQATNYLQPGGLLLSELGFEQEKHVYNLFKDAGCWKDIEILNDLSNYPRAIKVIKKDVA